MNHLGSSYRRTPSVMTDEQHELKRCKQEIARLKQLVVRLSEIVLRDVVKSAQSGRNAPECPSEPPKS
ncbi:MULTISPECIES: hypothetical protein [unclassified Bradyrhizobium]|uniref:hypothetical protein n=1 Tax=unclassified Bradyrhizobium TaxID=2631580 RepID=UPI001CD4C4DD|nr:MULTISPECIES: hypothetical protein [unclassified Bradyrhizobium]MCA1385639.1 hypothetical protein [Bradyrhizobium sp. BRP05]MCA1394325.1 hypothetical protein [Bradyrhizobium sp. IC3123]MCA1422641.1 hypothetical protein [Bradyrhizobium sp. BRP23]MCA1429080.1 hypothetical protein [Bradyrhizobium sp. NBAIM16]MCA1480070.1 hypothetical protein [Bradyrhizobium sp. NBAIM08]